MLQFIKRYRAYLIRRAELCSGAGLISEARCQGVPWLALPLPVWALCWLVGAPRPVERWALGLAIAMTLVGYSLVLWEFFVIPVRNDFRRARGRSEDELD